ncbi:MAG: hypothetical protein RIR18_818 [Pseudomonadota bacterium]|jgi:DNA ligase-1
MNRATHAALLTLLLAPIESISFAAQFQVSLPKLFAEQSTGKNITSYWISEKLDGVRAIWDGQTLRFKSGRVITAPAWFTAGFPNSALDGELWLGRQQFEALSRIVRRQQPNDGVAASNF